MKKKWKPQQVTDAPVVDESPETPTVDPLAHLTPDTDLREVVAELAKAREAGVSERLVNNVIMRCGYALEELARAEADLKAGK